MPVHVRRENENEEPSRGGVGRYSETMKSGFAQSSLRDAGRAYSFIHVYRDIKNEFE